MRKATLKRYSIISMYKRVWGKALFFEMEIYHLNSNKRYLWERWVNEIYSLKKR